MENFQLMNERKSSMILDFRISGNFIFEKAPWLTWRQIAYGYWHNYLDSKAVIEFSVSRLAVSSTDLEVDLAVSDPVDSEKINFLLDELKKKSPVSDCSETWFFIILSWLYDNREFYKETLLTIKLVYEEFGRPENLKEIINFIDSRESESKIYKSLHEYLIKYKLYLIEE